MKKWAISSVERKDNMEHGIFFEVNGIKKHSYLDFGFLLAPVEIPLPTPKESYVDIEGGDGSLDLTEAYGEIFYDDRQFSITFSCDPREYEFKTKRFLDYIHGRKCKMTFYNDDQYYYVGRLKANKYNSSSGRGQLTLNVRTQPYKLKQIVSVATNTIKGTGVINYLNDRKTTIPTFKASAEMNFVFNDNQYSFSGAETVFPNVLFKHGDNVIKWTGNGIVEVSYQEGAI